MRKYRNKIVTVDGRKFQSKKEGLHYLYLKELQEKGTIKNLQCQTKLDFKIDGKHIFNYLADFSYEDEFGMHYIDVKSEATAKLPLFKLKKKLIEAQHHIEIEVVI